jgi:hypothetical protein
MKWMIAAFASVALATLSLSIPAPVFTKEASANNMNGKGNCAGGTCATNTAAPKKGKAKH